MGHNREGGDRDQILHLFGNGTQAAAESIQNGIDTFLAELYAENLIVPLPQAPSLQGTPATPVQKLAFQTPVIEKFTDMADLLLLDPIHEVDETAGWPRANPNTRQK